MSCEGALQDPRNNCIVTRGILTLFLDQEMDEKREALEAIKKEMENGQYNDVDNAIVRVSFLGDESLTNSSDSGAVSEKPSSPSGFPIWAYVLIALGILLFIGLIIFVLRRGKETAPGKRDADTRADFREESIEADDDDSYEPPYDQNDNYGGSVHRF